MRSIITQKFSIITQKFPGGPFKFQEISRISRRVFKFQEISRISRSCRHPVVHLNAPIKCQRCHILFIMNDFRRLVKKFSDSDESRTESGMDCSKHLVQQQRSLKLLFSNSIQQWIAIIQSAGKACTSISVLCHLVSPTVQCHIYSCYNW